MSAACAITGLALVCAAGDTPETLWHALLRGRPLDAGDGTFPAARIAGFDPRRYVQRKGIGLLSRTSQLACAAASKLVPGLADVPPERVGVVFGTAWASLDTVVRFEREAHVEGPRQVDPILFTETVANVPAGQVSILFGWSALNATLSTGTGSGLVALERAAELIDEGRADAIVAGGADELNEYLLRTLHAEGALAPAAPARPYAPDAAGALGGEGACLVVLERERHAAERGAPVLGRLVGAISGFCAPDDAGREAYAAERLQALLAGVGWAPDDVDLLLLSGNGNRRRDREEATLVAALRATRASAPLAVLPKSILGETWGASGPLGVVIAVLCMARSEVPPAAGGFPGAPSMRLPEAPLRCVVRRALVLDVSETGQLAAVAVAAG